MSRKKRQRDLGNQKRASRKPQLTSLYVAVPLFVLVLLVGGVWLLNQRQPASAATPEEVAAEIIPQEGDATAYGIPLSLDNTQRFIDYHDAITVTWSIHIPIALSAQGLIAAQVPQAMHYFGSFGPMTAALILTGITEGGTGIRTLLGRLLKWRVDFRYYAFAVLAPLGLFGVAVLLNRIVTGAWPDLSLLGEADYLSYLGPFGVLGLWFLTYGLGEETGWRGFALPRLQRTRPAASATLILAVLWAFWHLPAFLYRDTFIEMGILGFPMFLVSIIFAAMVFTWIYNGTGGSLLLVTLFHAFFNWLSVSEAGGQFVAISMSAPTIVWAIYVVRRYGPENAAPIGKQVA